MSFDSYQQKASFSKLTQVEILDDDLGYYLAKVGTNEILNVTFKNPREAVHHAVSEYWIISTNENQ